METLMSIFVGVLVAIGTYLILTKNLLRIILGTSIIGHAVNILIITTGGLKKGGPPLLWTKDLTYADSLPQALILTAIVINFATTALFLVLSYRSYQVLGVDDTEKLRGIGDE
ncbi:multisubunit sodium/proton antiporter, MrpC subunit [Schinkia azotoformans MEV2011]|uniref:Multisubunit sodium/proton antiporter, MrpC subunit n=1 Tax=Schinkia azotoformans MEV2011 TaxID=1348973 RepID=A0A072NG47_SCHAZ|nr:Na(+)/H(+) antiporter subunit C [Schinkia azotoformans]KEF36639.1 multisubunit sodium/proton antiporter, MrpC subunit [Schinkia azotoformans MEV2011]MEC1695604.1 Na(+)/H(+) antiporter subunit C [Schinkia azotoformans]MEC1714227.1 Na(+)/H(+) antiporter subunit C [Schinkia azotoformans]MEC1723998.1 Na(+)/H(+) antiporter subunit C [Schinkia azotoformans]MEC1742442.1 Na(+)/H(+) antiporter subunit C [Schinkia azotoformans]